MIKEAQKFVLNKAAAAEFKAFPDIRDANAIIDADTKTS